VDNDVLIPRPGIQQIDYRGVPLGFYNKVSAVVRNSFEAERLAEFFGSTTFMPAFPVLLMLPGDPTLIGGRFDLQPADKLRDMAMEQFEAALKKLDESGGGLVMWERGGPVSAAEIQKQLPAAAVRQRTEKEEGF
jgi:hypothetical protein